MTCSTLVSISIFVGCLLAAAYADPFHHHFNETWGGPRAQILDNGGLVTLSLDRYSGSGFVSKKDYLFGKFEVQLKLVPGYSAGTVTAFYISSLGMYHDEVDFEFLGKVDGDPYILHTNFFCQGKGEKEQMFYLWFDPTADFHNYTIFWNPQRIILLVDGIPIREFNNFESKGIPFPSDQPMKIYSSIWNADDWATKGGLVKTDYSKEPFTASFRNFSAQGCVVHSGTSSCDSRLNYEENSWLSLDLDLKSRKLMKRVRNKYMFYDYCTDKKRFFKGLPPECIISNKLDNYYLSSN